MNSFGQKKSRVLLCAYACSPDQGSEESVGWDTATGLSGLGHQVVVLTRSDEAALSKNRASSLPSHQQPEFISFDLPRPLRALLGRLGKLGVEAGYYFWLRKARREVRRLHAQYDFTSCQHVTYARYWMPSPVSVLDIPFVWGPVGGGETIPTGLKTDFSLSGRLFENIRDTMRHLGEKSDLTRMNAVASTIGLANTRETAERMQALGAKNVELINSAALSDRDIAALDRPHVKSDTIVFASIGRLLEWKGFHLGLEAFARANMKNASYLIVGSGPQRQRLQQEAFRLAIALDVVFIDSIPPDELLTRMQSVNALVHPSMHESGGYVVLEAMASRIPVICLEAGGPSLFVDETCGYVAPVSSRDEAIDYMANAMQQICEEPANRTAKGESARSRVIERFSMAVKLNKLSVLHTAYASPQSKRTESIPFTSSNKAASERAASRPAKSSGDHMIARECA